MSNILLVEPDYKSKFPPLGLLRISTFHKERGDSVTFVRGRDEQLRSLKWHKVYVSSLFTYELPRTIKTLRFYRPSVDNSTDLIVGGIGATLMPDYIQGHLDCRIIKGTLSRPGLLDNEKKPIEKYDPDYTIIDNEKWDYAPRDAYFCRITTGCVRKCKFCAVPTLEPNFAYIRAITAQVKAIDNVYGPRQNLVLLDNNILACDRLENIINCIEKMGFHAGAKVNGKKRYVDFNQGIDARLITGQISKLLSRVCLSPVRLAFDFTGMKKQYITAIKHLANSGFGEFTNYVMYNFDDNPADFYHRIRLNAEISAELGIRVTSFPMRFRPIYSSTKGYVSDGWQWRYLRGIQCVLLATHGLVSPNLTFFDAAFGEDVNQFCEILSMPDRYIIFRKKYKNDGVQEWSKLYRRLSESKRAEFLDALATIKSSRDKKKALAAHTQFASLLEHYYPDGHHVACA